MGDTNELWLGMVGRLHRGIVAGVIQWTIVLMIRSRFDGLWMRGDQRTWSLDCRKAIATGRVKNLGSSEQTTLRLDLWKHVRHGKRWVFLIKQGLGCLLIHLSCLFLSILYFVAWLQGAEIDFLRSIEWCLLASHETHLHFLRFLLNFRQIFAKVFKVFREHLIHVN